MSRLAVCMLMVRCGPCWMNHSNLSRWKKSCLLSIKMSRYTVGFWDLMHEKRKSSEKRSGDISLVPTIVVVRCPKNWSKISLGWIGNWGLIHCPRVCRTHILVGSPNHIRRVPRGARWRATCPSISRLRAPEDDTGRLWCIDAWGLLPMTELPGRWSFQCDGSWIDEHPGGIAWALTHL